MPGDHDEGGSLQVRVTRLDPGLPLPVRGTTASAGFDLYSRLDIDVPPRQVVRIPSNIVVAVPAGYVMIIVLRSGTPARTGLVSPGGIGIIDQDYCGPEDEISVQVFNPGTTPVTIRRGERIAQAIILPLPAVEWDEGRPVTQESRGGFGSTG